MIFCEGLFWGFEAVGVQGGGGGGFFKGVFWGFWMILRLRLFWRDFGIFVFCLSFWTIDSAYLYICENNY